MNTLTATELDDINGGITPGWLTQLGEHLAADGLVLMDSLNPLKSGLGTIVAAGGGWAWAFGSAYDGIAAYFNW
jgi:hypothetical protein